MNAAQLAIRSAINQHIIGFDDREPVHDGPPSALTMADAHELHHFYMLLTANVVAVAGRFVCVVLQPNGNADSELRQITLEIIKHIKEVIVLRTKQMASEDVLCEAIQIASDTIGANILKLRMAWEREMDMDQEFASREEETDAEFEQRNDAEFDLLFGLSSRGCSVLLEP